MSLLNLSRPVVVDDRPPDDDSQLSLFQQTLREKDEEFYKAFPAARIAIEQDPYSYVCRPIQSSYLPGPSFQLRHVAFQDSLDYPYDVTPTQPMPQMSSQSPSSLSFDSAHLPSSHPTSLYETSSQSHYSAYGNVLVSPTDGQGEQPVEAPVAPVLNVRPPPFNLPYPVQPRQFHPPQQRIPSPVMDSLSPPPDLASDPSQAFHHSSHYHTPPHQVYYPALPLNANATPSPTNQDIPPPLSPPALVQATYPIKREPEQQAVFADPLPSPLRESSIPPSRRNSQHALHRSQRRYSPPYPRSSHSTHKSGGSGNAVPALVPPMGWPVPSSAPTTPSGVNVNANGNVGTSLVDAAGTAAARAPTATVVPAPLPGSSISGSAAVLKPRPSVNSLNQPSTHRSASANSTAVINSKRNSDKKPALACVFCRGRKIACGPPLKDGDGKTCNQCHRRSLRCEYPTESRRGMRKKPSGSTTTTTTNANPSRANLGAGGATLSDSNDDSDNPKANTKSASPKAMPNKKR